MSCWAPMAVNLLYWTLGRETHPGAWPSGSSSPRSRPPPHLTTRLQPSPSHDARGRPWSPQALGRCHPLPRFPYSLQHPQGYHVWKHVCQALGSHVADAVIVQAAGNRSQGRGWGAGVQGPGGSTPSRDYCPSLQRVS